VNLDLKHRLGDIRRSLWPHYKECRIHRLGDEDAWWLEREHEVYRKYERRYADLIADGASGGNRVRRDRVWVFWQQGMKNAPDLVRACYESVLLALPDKEVTVVTGDNLTDFVDLPGYVVDKFRSGAIPHAQFSDLVRISLIANHGGTWMDSTVLLTGGNLPRYTMSLPLFCFKQINISNKDVPPILSSNWYISGYTNSRILELTRALLLEYWRTHNRLEQYFMFHIFFAMACRRYPEEWATVPTYNNATPHELMFELGDAYNPARWEQICRATDVHKLTRHVGYGEGTNYRYVVNKYLGRDIID
jgi:hypothetical protein